jgi:hypothetical protein
MVCCIFLVSRFYATGFVQFYQISNLLGLTMHSSVRRPNWVLELRILFMHIHNPSLDFVEMPVSDQSYAILSDVRLIFLSFRLF